MLCTRAECSYTSDTKPTTPRGAITAIFGSTPSTLPLLIVNVSVQTPLSRVTTEAANKANWGCSPLNCNNWRKRIFSATNSS